jgi:hypothetical protein
MNRCKYCRRSLDCELETDLLLSGGLCTECANEEQRERRERLDEQLDDQDDDDGYFGEVDDLYDSDYEDRP